MTDFSNGGSSVVTLKFKVYSEQADMIQRALDKVRAEFQTDFHTVALEIICASYLGETIGELPDNPDAPTEKALEARARRRAKYAGFKITKSRARNLTHENHGGFQIRDAMSGFPVAGHWFEFSAQDVIDYFAS
jgi:hypothetical protein